MNRQGMTLDYALALFIVMLTAQIPLLIAAIIAYFRSRTVAAKVEEVAVSLATNTALTAETKDKTEGNTEALSKIDKQTNGDMDKIKEEVHGLKKGQEVAKQEVVDTRHDLLNVLNVVVSALNVERMQKGLPPLQMPPRAKDQKHAAEAPDLADQPAAAPPLPPFEEIVPAPRQALKPPPGDAANDERRKL